MDCIFPFKMKNDITGGVNTFNECFQNPRNGEYYCAVEVDSNGNVVRDMLGVCNEQCELPGAYKQGKEVDNFSIRVRTHDQNFTPLIICNKMLTLLKKIPTFQVNVPTC